MATFLPSPIDWNVSDIAIGADEGVWVPNGPGVEFKPLHFWGATGTWAQLSRIQPGVKITRHVHTGGQVFAYTLEGSWHYLEHDWVARPGTWVWEPPADVHTLEVLGDVPMTALFVLSGVVQYLDENDQVVKQDEFRLRRSLYTQHCAKLGVDPIAIL
jgi:hypothetical protein